MFVGHTGLIVGFVLRWLKFVPIDPILLETVCLLFSLESNLGNWSDLCNFCGIFFFNL